MDAPFFSILIPVYGSVGYLRLCLESVTNQRFSSFEIVICYQGDVERENEVFDCRIREIYLERPSAYRARTESYRQALGSYVLFLDSDDELLPGALDRIYDIVQQNPDVDIVQFGYTSSKQRVDETNLRPEKSLLSKDEYLSYFLSELGTYPIWRKCFKRNDVSFYDEDIFMGDDALLTLAFIEASRRIVSISDTLYYYRLNDKSGTSNLKVKYFEDLSVFMIHSIPFRNAKSEIEMGIYSYLSTFMVYCYTFPEVNLLSSDKVKSVFDWIFQYDFEVRPSFLKKRLGEVARLGDSRRISRLTLFGYSLLRRLRHNFSIHLIAFEGVD